MPPSSTPPAARDPLLFTPGPLTTSFSVKQAMLHDAGSWHHEFHAVVRWIRERLLTVAGVTHEDGWECVLLQGSGTYGVEAVFTTCVPPDGKVAVLANGAYGERAAQILARARIQHCVFRTPENLPVPPTALNAALAADPAVTHVFVVHCETSSGLLNPVAELGHVTRAHGRSFIVDAMSSFGGIPVDWAAAGVDFLVSSANKCLEGVPGCCFVLCRRDKLLACEGWARTLSLDLLAQLKGFESNGQFRFTPPTHALLALAQALRELEEEGGVPARAARYRRNHATLLAGMGALGLVPWLEPAFQSPVITAFPLPPVPGFTFEALYRGLCERGFIIYPGKLTQADTFRIGTIGRLFPADIEQLVHTVSRVLPTLDRRAEPGTLAVHEG